MKNYIALFVILSASFFTINNAWAQVNPGNDPVMWEYVDPTTFWLIMLAMTVIIVTVLAIFRIQAQRPKKSE